MATIAASMPCGIDISACHTTDTALLPASTGYDRLPMNGAASISVIGHASCPAQAMPFSAQSPGSGMILRSPAK